MQTTVLPQASPAPLRLPTSARNASGICSQSSATNGEPHCPQQINKNMNYAASSESILKGLEQWSQEAPVHCFLMRHQPLELKEQCLACCRAGAPSSAPACRQPRRVSGQATRQQRQTVTPRAAGKEITVRPGAPHSCPFVAVAGLPCPHAERWLRCLLDPCRRCSPVSMQIVPLTVLGPCH